jgi:hypothetical protein
VDCRWRNDLIGVFDFGNAPVEVLEFSPADSLMAMK